MINFRPHLEVESNIPVVMLLNRTFLIYIILILLTFLLIKNKFFDFYFFFQI